MIHIEKDQNVAENPNLKIMTPTGDYDDNANIEFYDVGNPEIAAGSFQAQYVKYGGLVYKFNDPKELGNEILKIDPTSTHTAASYVRMTNDLLAQMNSGSLEPSSLDQALASEQVKMEEKMEEEMISDTNAIITDTTATSTPAADLPTNTPVQNPTNNLVSSTTPAASLETSTTTPAYTLETSTSTPASSGISTSTPSSASSTPTLNDTASSTIDAISKTVNKISSTTDAISNAVETIISSTTSPTS